MFSKRALAKLESSGKSPRAYARYAGDNFRESMDNIRRRASPAKSIVVFSFVFQILTVIASAPLYLPRETAAFVVMALVSMAGTAVLVAWMLLHVSLIRDESGTKLPLLAANKLTIARFLLVPPLLFLIAGDRFAAALIVYIICVATDVADGFVARWRNERTQFGTVMDPLADIFSTGTVFAVLLAKDYIPLWVFVLLMIRYGMLFAGTTVLFFTGGPLEFHATPVGKIVGVLQASAVILIVGFALSGMELDPTAQNFLFAFLGLIFCSVIVSQLVLGARIVIKRRIRVGS